MDDSSKGRPSNKAAALLGQSAPPLEKKKSKKGAHRPSLSKVSPRLLSSFSECPLPVSSSEILVRWSDGEVAEGWMAAEAGSGAQELPAALDCPQRTSKDL